MTPSPLRALTCLLLLLVLTAVLASCAMETQIGQGQVESPSPQITDLIATLGAQNEPEEHTPVPPTPTTVATTPVPVVNITQSPEEPSLSPTAAPETPVSTATATLRVTEPPKPTPTLEILFQDNFDQAMGWYTFDSDRYRMWFKDGSYHIFNNILGSAVNSVRSMNLSDVYLEVDAARVSGPPNAFYGLVCRFQDDSNYYALVVGSEGFYGIARLAGGSTEFISRPPSPNDALHGRLSANRIGARCAGDKLTLYANGVKLTEVTDSTFSTGFVGLVVGTTSVAGVEVRFDNFAIFNLGE